MRSLQSGDIFAACRLLKAIGVRDEIKKVAEKATSMQDFKSFDVGFDLIYNLFEMAVTSEAEKEWYKFFAGIFECKAEEVKQMDPCDFIDKVLEVADVQKWRDFFSKVLSLTNKN